MASGKMPCALLVARRRAWESMRDPAVTLHQCQQKLEEFLEPETEIIAFCPLESIMQPYSFKKEEKEKTIEKKKKKKKNGEEKVFEFSCAPVPLVCGQKVKTG